jgi:gamma-glutamyltranspeptidase/glutathione hydrolase
MARFSHNQVNNKLELESALFKLVGAQLTAMGHQVSSSNGSPVGGFEAILFTPDPRSGPGCAPADRACRAPIAGFYRAGSNFREDGQAAGF